jgi:hypothetical protein
MTRAIIVTGADKTYFTMGCLLMHSVAQAAPDLPFYFLDFGLEEAQRNYLRARGVLCERPPSVPQNTHPIVRKTALAEYLRDIAHDTVLWLDSDMLVVGALQQGLAEVITAMEAARSKVAACSVETIADLLSGGWPMAPFVDALKAEGVSFDLPYYNNGAVVFRSREFLDAWWQSAQHTPVHLCIDQNLFNLLVLRDHRVTALPAAVWNLHGALLGAARATAERGIVAGAELDMPSALILHPTSVRDQHHVTINVGQQALKMFRNPVLRERQLQTLLQWLEAHTDALAAAGIGNAGALRNAADAHFPSAGATTVRSASGETVVKVWGKVGRLDPCPCGSGKKYKHCHGRYT